MYVATMTNSKQECDAVIAYLKTLGFRPSPVRCFNAFNERAGVVWLCERDGSLDYYDIAGNDSLVGGHAVPFGEFAKQAVALKVKPPVKVKLNDQYEAIVRDGYVEVGCQKIPFAAISELARAIQ